MSNGDPSDPRYLLYGSQVSYYTVKVRSYLRFKGLQFQLLKVTNQIADDIIKPVTGGWRVVPILRTPQGKFIQDSSVILDHLEHVHSTHSITPPGIKQRVASALLELLGDDWLLFPAMHYRWNFKYYNLISILNAFGNNRTPHWPKAIRWLGGVPAALKFGGAASAILGITPANTAALEAWTVELLDQLDLHFSQHDYLLGGRPCYGDFSLYGPLQAHLASDPYPKKHLIEPRKNIQAWLQRMDSTPTSISRWVPDDDIPETLVPILQWQVRDQLPFIQKVIEHTAAWLDDNPEASTLPRFIGKASYEIKSARGDRVCAPYSQWMYQRVHGHFARASSQARDELLLWCRGHDIHMGFDEPDQPVDFRHSRVCRVGTHQPTPGG